jgi:hypothetical protein
MGGSKITAWALSPGHTPPFDQLSAGKGYTGITGHNTIGIADKQVGRSRYIKRKELSVGPASAAGAGDGAVNCFNDNGITGEAGSGAQQVAAAVTRSFA